MPARQGGSISFPLSQGKGGVSRIAKKCSFTVERKKERGDMIPGPRHLPKGVNSSRRRCITRSPNTARADCIIAGRRLALRLRPGTPAGGGKEGKDQPGRSMRIGRGRNRPVPALGDSKVRGKQPCQTWRYLKVAVRGGYNGGRVACGGSATLGHRR